jgi:hypothetical protein
MKTVVKVGIAIVVIIVIWLFLKSRNSVENFINPFHAMINNKASLTPKNFNLINKLYHKTNNSGYIAEQYPTITGIDNFFLRDSMNRYLTKEYSSTQRKDIIVYKPKNMNDPKQLWSYRLNYNGKFLNGSTYLYLDNFGNFGVTQGKGSDTTRDLVDVTARRMVKGHLNWNLIAIPGPVPVPVKFPLPGPAPASIAPGASYVLGPGNIIGRFSDGQLYMS